MINFSDLFVGLNLALRARYFWLVGVSLLTLVLAALLASMFSGRQPATVALDVGISVMRLLLPFVLVLMAQELLSREFDRRYFLSSLSYPRPRLGFLFGRFLAVLALTHVLLLSMALILAFLVGFVAQGYVQATPVVLGFHYLVVIFFLGMDLTLLTAIACLLAVVASSPSFVLVGTLGFMLVSRSFGAVIELLNRNQSLVFNADNYRSGVGALGYLLPDLGALDVRMITLYGTMDFLSADWHWLLLSSLGYLLSLLGLAIWALQRKKFS